jgi:hypothetical protein
MGSRWILELAGLGHCLEHEGAQEFSKFSTCFHISPHLSIVPRLTMSRRVTIWEDACSRKSKARKSTNMSVPSDGQCWAERISQNDLCFLRAVQNYLRTLKTLEIFGDIRRYHDIVFRSGGVSFSLDRWGIWWGALLFSSLPWLFSRTLRCFAMLCD